MASTKYATSPLYADLTPIPLSDDMTLDTSPTAHPIQPLATIAYSPAYLDATSYLRALMARNEYSERAVALTADVIAMNPAHYTVWLYRVKCLKVMNSLDSPQPGGGGQPRPAPTATSSHRWIHDELSWLNAVSRKNLKNYQIWHHRRSLVDLLPTPPADEADFLTAMLALDTKNYHVWTYRQWLCARFPEHLLSDPGELERVEVMIEQDIHNNSAWCHRWFLVFGAEDLIFAERENGGMGGLKGVQEGKRGRALDEEVVERELGYVRAKIERAPQNLAAWNYLRGVLRRAGRGLDAEEGFCEGFVGADGDVEGIDPRVPGAETGVEMDVDGEGTGQTGEKKNGVRSSHAVECLAEIWGARGDLERAGRCWDVLGRKWDPVRRNYWEYRRKKVENAWRERAGDQ